MPPPPADPNQKRKNRQSLSITKSAQEEIAQHVQAEAAPTPAAPTVPRPAPAAVVGSPLTALRELPALRDAPPNKREELFKLKLQLCGVIFSFDDPTSDKRGKVSCTPVYVLLVVLSLYTISNTLSILSHICRT